MFPHGPRPTTMARARIETPSVTKAMNVMPIATRESGVGDAEVVGPDAAAWLWLVTNEPVTTPA